MLQKPTPRRKIDNDRDGKKDCTESRSCKRYPADKPLQTNAAVQALRNVSEEIDDLGITMTVFNACGQQVFQQTVGTYFCTQVYCPVQSSNYSKGWSADTVHGIFSATKMMSAAVFMVAVVEPDIAS